MSTLRFTTIHQAFFFLDLSSKVFGDWPNTFCARVKSVDQSINERGKVKCTKMYMLFQNFVFQCVSKTFKWHPKRIVEKCARFIFINYVCFEKNFMLNYEPCTLILNGNPKLSSVTGRDVICDVSVLLNY